MSVLKRYQSFFGDGSIGEGSIGDDLFQHDGQSPLIPIHIINPMDSSSLASIETSMASDYRVTIDDADIDPSESIFNASKK